MFGRRREPPSSPLPPGGREPFPIDKMDSALDGAIRLFTRVLDDAGVDSGGLAIRGEVPDNVEQRLANCTTYRGGADGGPVYLALGLTTDFKAFHYPPHCRLYFILNSVGICEDPAAASILPGLAPQQLPAPLIDAHFMRRWIHFILPTAEALKEGSGALEALMRRLVNALVEAADLVPKPFGERIKINAVLHEWISGFPGTIGRPLDDSVPRMNGLPVTPFIADILTTELARLQAEGLRQQHG